MIRRRWTIQEETELKALIEGNLNIEEIAARTKKDAWSSDCEMSTLRLAAADSKAT